MTDVERKAIPAYSNYSNLLTRLFLYTRILVDGKSGNNIDSCFFLRAFFVLAHNTSLRVPFKGILFPNLLLFEK